MKNRKVIPSLFVSLLIVLSAAAQNPDGPTPNELSLPDQIAAARRQHTETTDISPDPNAGKALAQLPRGGPPMMPRQEYYRGSYQNPLMRSGNAGHTLIGAAIGFGLGATMGALGSIHGHTPVGSGVLIGGSIFGLIGGAIGASHGGLAASMPRRGIYSPWPDQDEESKLHSPSRRNEGRPEPSVTRTAVASGQPAELQASASPSAARQAVP
jgi:hypothetical protein